MTEKEFEKLLAKKLKSETKTSLEYLNLIKERVKSNQQLKIQKQSQNNIKFLNIYKIAGITAAAFVLMVGFYNINKILPYIMVNTQNVSSTTYSLNSSYDSVGQSINTVSSSLTSSLFISKPLNSKSVSNSIVSTESSSFSSSTSSIRKVNSYSYAVNEFDLAFNKSKGRIIIPPYISDLNLSRIMLKNLEDANLSECIYIGLRYRNGKKDAFLQEYYDNSMNLNESKYKEEYKEIIIDKNTTAFEKVKENNGYEILFKYQEVTFVFFFNNIEKDEIKKICNSIINR